jgi:murein DD-endopeptidase MepM/ murein hydrolase activator NlpD
LDTGTYVTPCICEARVDTPVVAEETFAPILYLMRYRSLEEAVAIHNQVPQGLSSAIMTTDLREAEFFLSQRGSDCGIANVNIGTSGAEIGGAFGGEKDTGGGIPQEMRDQVKALQSAVVKQKNDFETLNAKLEGQVNLLAATPSIRPTTGWVTSRFGYRKSPFTGARTFHSGLDIATRQGTPVVAPADGAITFAGPKGLMGNMLTIRHGHGIVTRYGHLSKIFKKVGAKVKRGDLIAHVGNTGRSTGPHLHYEVLLSGVPVNPARYILN